MLSAGACRIDLTLQALPFPLDRSVLNGCSSLGLVPQSIKGEVWFRDLEGLFQPGKSGIAEPLQPSSSSDSLSWGLEEAVFSTLSAGGVGVPLGSLRGVKWGESADMEYSTFFGQGVVTGFPSVPSVSSANSPRGQKLLLFLLIDGKGLARLSNCVSN